MDQTTEDAYDTLLSVAGVDAYVLDLMRSIARGDVDADELMQRWDREHVTNGAGRIEGRIYEDEGAWIADPQTGFADPRQFDSEQAARAWIQTGGHYETPVGR
jgi:hypothetical protein